jgi:PHD/YefM family antitoxin component YafN of YafNO toxin-antitoxin module
MNVTATEAKNRFGYMCAQAKSEPVFIEKDGRVDTVIVSFEQFEALKDAGNKESAARRQRDFNRKYKAWIDEVNQDFDSNGLWCDGVRMW